MHKKCRNVRDLGNSVQHWIHVVATFLVLSSRSLHVFLVYVLVVPCLRRYHLINVNLACLLNLWPGNQQCWSASSRFRLFRSFWWLLSLKLNAVSDLPEYCLLHTTNSIRYIRYLLLQLSLLYILKVFCVNLLLKVFLDCTLYSIDCLTWSCRLQIAILINILM